MTYRRLTAWLALLLALPLLAACAAEQQAVAEETALRQSLVNWVILGQKPAGIDVSFPEGQTLARTPTIVIQDDGSPANRALKLANHDIAILDPTSIRRRADEQGDFPYLRFDRVQLTGDKANVRLSLAWALSQATLQTGRGPSDSGGVELILRRRGGQWVAERLIALWRA